MSNALKKYPDDKPRQGLRQSKPQPGRGGNVKSSGKKQTGRRPGQTVKKRKNKIAGVAGGERVKSNARAVSSTGRMRAGTVEKTKNNWFAFATSVQAYLVLIPTVALLLLGLVMVFSAGQVVGLEQGVGSYRYFVLQTAWAGLGITLMIFFAKFDYHKLGKISWLGFLVSIALLVLVLLLGTDAYGAKRWLEIGWLNLQPTEIAKFTLMLFCANVLANKSRQVKEFVHILPVLIAMLITAVLFMMQPDLGSTIVICVSIFILLIIAGSDVKHLLLIGTAGSAAAVLLAIIEPYRFQRILAFMHPEKYEQGASYQLMQSYIALGSGNIKGVGLGMSKQKFLYLPNAHNDFIFSIIGEELGLVGTVAVVALIGLLMYGGYRIARNAPDKLGLLLSVGIVGLIVVQAIVNMGGVTGLMPITGVPLPLVSSGGSSLCICMGCIGILLNVAAQSETRKRGAS